MSTILIILIIVAICAAVFGYLFLLAAAADFVVTSIWGAHYSMWVYAAAIFVLSAIFGNSARS